tara:strand:- start:54 stop:224 length:171 start_codon:yes stop_codon:yes gene_type:complete
MENIIEKLEVLIDDIERDESLTKEDIHKALSQLKTEIEDYQLRREEGSSLEWEDLD